MTDYLDSATIRTATSIASAELVIYQDSAILGAAVTASVVESAYGVESAVVTTITKPRISLSEVIHITTTDYNWSPWLTTYTLDGSIPVVGSVGTNDSDSGILV